MSARPGQRGPAKNGVVCVTAPTGVAVRFTSRDREWLQLFAKAEADGVDDFTLAERESISVWAARDAADRLRRRLGLTGQRGKCPSRRGHHVARALLVQEALRLGLISNEVSH
jgi:hypothetical protein